MSRSLLIIKFLLLMCGAKGFAVADTKMTRVELKPESADEFIIQKWKARTRLLPLIPIVNAYNFHTGKNSSEDWIIKFKDRLEPMGRSEAREAKLLYESPAHASMLDELAMAQEEIEDILPLNLVLVVVRSNENDAIPFLLSDLNTKPDIFRVEQIRNPKKLSEQKLAQVFDLRRYFIDVTNPENPPEKLTISLATALLEDLLTVEAVSDILLNQLPYSESITFKLSCGRESIHGAGQVVLNSGDDSVKIPNEFCLSGTGQWIKLNLSQGGVQFCDGQFQLVRDALARVHAEYQIFSKIMPVYSNIRGYFYIDPTTSLPTKIQSGFELLRPWYGYNSNWNGFALNGSINNVHEDLLATLSGGLCLSRYDNSGRLNQDSRSQGLHASTGKVLKYLRSKHRQVVVTRPLIKFRKDHEYRVSVSDSQGHFLQSTTAILRNTPSKILSTTYRSNIPRAHPKNDKDRGASSSPEEVGKRFISAQVPDLSSPWDWKEGDELAVTRRGTYSGAFILGFSKVIPLKIHAGSNMDVRGSYELTVKRLNRSRIEVTLNPITFEEFGVFKKILQVPGLNSSHGIALALRQKFIFDFAGGESMDAFGVQSEYRRLVEKGELPNELGTRFNIIEEKSDPGQIIEYFALENRSLVARGIERYTLEICVLDYQHLSSLTKVDRGGERIFEVERIRGAGNRVVVADNAAIESKISESLTNEHKIKSGQLIKKAFSTINTIWEVPQPGKIVRELNNIVLSAGITDTKITGHDNNRIRNELNQSFNMDFDEFAFPAQHESRTVVLERTLAKEDLENLRESRNTDMAVMHSQVGERDIYEFLGSIHDQGAGKIAERVRDFVAEHGIHGFGAIHYLLGGGEKDIRVRTMSSIYTEALQQSDAFIQKWSKEGEVTEGEIKAKLKTNTGKTSVQEFFQNGESILAKLKTANAALDDDKFMIAHNDKRPWPQGARESKRDLRHLIQEAYATVHKLLYLGHMNFNERALIFKKVMRLKRNLFQRAVVHGCKFANAIQPGDSRCMLRKRFKESSAILHDLKGVREEVNSTNILSPEDRVDLLAELAATEEHARKVISLQRLRSVEDYDALTKNLSKARLVPWPSSHRHRMLELDFQEIITASKARFVEARANPPVADSEVQRDAIIEVGDSAQQLPMQKLSTITKDPRRKKQEDREIAAQPIEKFGTSISAICQQMTPIREEFFTPMIACEATSSGDNAQP